MRQIRYKYHDGGREDAGYKGSAGDCTPRAIAIALDQGYRKTRKELDALNKEMTGGLGASTQNGTPSPVRHRYLLSKGWQAVVTKGAYMDAKSVPMDERLIVCLHRHDVAVIDGVAYDTWDSRVSRRTRNGKPTMRGYYLQIN